MGYEEPKPDEHVDVGCKGPMLLDDTFSEPIRRTWTFIQVAVNGPSLATRRIERPARLGGSSENRVLHGKDQSPTRDERARRLRHEPAQVLEIMQGERAIDQI